MNGFPFSSSETGPNRRIKSFILSLQNHQYPRYFQPHSLEEKTYLLTVDPPSSITSSISACFRSCISINLESTVFLTQNRVRNVGSTWPIRKTRQKACCSAAWFHQGSMTITREAIVRLRPTGQVSVFPPQTCHTIFGWRGELTTTASKRGKKNPLFRILSKFGNSLVPRSKALLALILSTVNTNHSNQNQL